MTLGVLEFLRLLCPSLCVRTSTRRLTTLPGSVLLASNSDSIDATSCEPFLKYIWMFWKSFWMKLWNSLFNILKHCLKADQSQLSDLESSLWTNWLRWRLHALSVSEFWACFPFFLSSSPSLSLTPLPFPSFLPFNSFIEIYFIYYTVHTSTVHKTMIFSILTYMWNHHQSILELFISKKKSVPLAITHLLPSLIRP